MFGFRDDPEVIGGLSHRISPPSQMD
jgi:hypothetical protein